MMSCASSRLHSLLVLRLTRARTRRLGGFGETRIICEQSGKVRSGTSLTACLVDNVCSGYKWPSGFRVKIELRASIQKEGEFGRLDAPLPPPLLTSPPTPP